MQFLNHCRIIENEDGLGSISLTLGGICWTKTFRDFDTAAHEAERLKIIPDGMALQASRRIPGLPRSLMGNMPLDYDLLALVGAGFDAGNERYKG